MKQLLIFIIFNLTFTGYVFSQSGAAINATGAPADNSAMLDVSGTGKGFLIPRLTTVHRPEYPVESLLIYNTDTQCFEAYNAKTSQWVNVSCLTSCPVPLPPEAATHATTKTQITWNWKPITGVTGYKWNTTNDYSTATDNGTSTTHTQSGLTCCTYYTIYVWAYNSCGNSVPGILTQITAACDFVCGSTLTDSRDGKNYTTVLIGTQCWMKENLNVGTFVKSNYIKANIHSDVSDNGIIEKYCYNDSTKYCDVYGGLYDWDEMMQYVNKESTQGICPVCWHIPSNDEWKQLEMFLGMSKTEADRVGYRGTDEGGKIKEAGTAHWLSPNSGATNSSGFTALPGDNRGGYGNFDTNVGRQAHFWTSSSFNSDNSWGRHLFWENGIYNWNTYPRPDGFSVRCVRN